MKYYEDGDNIDLNIKKIFDSDSREKKNIGKNVIKRASRRGYVKGMKTQVDFLKGKEKKKYMGNGEISMSNMYSDIKNLPNKDELLLMDKNKIVLILTEVIKTNTVTAIYKKLGYKSCGGAYSLFHKYNINYQKNPTRAKPRINIEMQAESSNSLVAATISPLNSTISSVAIENNEVDEFTIRFNGVYDKAKIENRIVNILTTLDNDCKYEITFKLTEKK